MKTRCLIVDDEPLALEVIKSHISQVQGLEVVGAYQNALEVFEVLKTEPIDLIFLDIQMPVLTGIEFLKSLSNPPKVIFTTAYRDYAIEAYELEVVDYLLKPISFTRFFKSINKYFALRTAESPVQVKETVHEEAEFIDVKSNKKTFRIRLQDISYIESLKDYVRIHLPDKRITSKEKISDFEGLLPEHFMRVHRSYIVNLRAITAFTTHDIELGDQEIPIGISYKNQVLNALNSK